jgi:hypothetical protein
LGTAFYQAGITGLLVPAAIATTAREYPRFRVVCNGRATVHTTPTEGTNLVIFRSNRRPGDSWRERVAERFVCEIAGLASESSYSVSVARHAPARPGSGTTLYPERASVATGHHPAPRRVSPAA